MNPNPEDLNPAHPNIRDDSVERMTALCVRWFIAFALIVLAVLVWLMVSLTQQPKVGEEYATWYPKWTNGVEQYSIQKLGPPIVTNEIDLSAMLTMTSIRIFSPNNEEWLSSDIPEGNNWHWTNVVFSSTREPVVTKTNGEWRIGFK